MKGMKHGHRSHKKANQVPKSATFNAKKPPIQANTAFSATSKRKS
jgi:hypothetical protein